MNENNFDISAEAKLKRVITDYKKYDKKRNEYYSDKMRELGMLQSIIQELEDSTGVKSIVNTINTLKDHNAKLNKEIQKLRNSLDEVRTLLTPEISNIYKNLSNKDSELLIKISKLQSEIVDYKNKVADTQALANEYLKNLIKLQTNEEL